MIKGLVNQIFYEKIASIQNKIPVKLNIPEMGATSFNQILHEQIHSSKNVHNSYNPSTDSNTFDHIISEASSTFNVSEALIKSVISAESNFNPSAISSAGAKGLMQLMPLTADHLGVKNVWDPKQNIEGGTKYLRELMDRYDGDMTLVLAAYNAGPTNVDKYKGVPPFKETQNYVKKVLNDISKFNTTV